MVKQRITKPFSVISFLLLLLQYKTHFSSFYSSTKTILIFIVDKLLTAFCANYFLNVNSLSGCKMTVQVIQRFKVADESTYSIMVTTEECQSVNCCLDNKWNFICDEWGLRSKGDVHYQTQKLKSNKLVYSIKKILHLFRVKSPKSTYCLF